MHRSREYELRLLDLTNKNILYVTQKLEHGNKAGRLLAYLARPNYTTTSIPQIQTSLGHISDSPQETVETFLSFYTDLYATKVQDSEPQLDEYLAQISFPSLSTHTRKELEAPLSAEEIALAISQLPTHKTPGLDRFPAERYAQFQPLLCPFRLCTFNKALEAGVLPPSMREALI